MESTCHAIDEIQQICYDLVDSCKVHRDSEPPFWQLIIFGAYPNKDSLVTS